MDTNPNIVFVIFKITIKICIWFNKIHPTTTKKKKKKKNKKRNKQAIIWKHVLLFVDYMICKYYITNFVSYLIECTKIYKCIYIDLYYI